MSVQEKQKAIDELLEKSASSLERKASFEAERMSLKALLIARQICDFDRMIQACAPLCSARKARLKAATSARKAVVMAQPITEQTKLKPGCYLVEPPQVGADARRLRLAALQNEVPVAVICREPVTKLKQWPVVAIGAGITIRTRIAPPRNEAKPDMDWFIGAMEQLGDWAVQTIDPTLEPTKRIELIIERLDTFPDHVGLHDALIETCREAKQAGSSASKDEKRSARKGSARRAEIRS